MKKIIFLTLALIGLLLYAAAKGNADQNSNSPCTKEFKIVMDRDGLIEEICWNNRRIYPTPSSLKNDIPLDPFIARLPGGEAFPKALSVGTKVTITIKIDDKHKYDIFKIDIIPQKSEYESVPIFAGKTELIKELIEIKAEPEEPPLISSFILNESGTTYQIKVTRSTSPQASPSTEASQNSTSIASGSESNNKNTAVSIHKSADADQNSSQGKIIFAESLQTRARYYLGSHVGVFIPFRESPDFNLGYTSPTDVNATIIENRLLNVTMVFIGSIYPFGFEPESKCISRRRIQLNLATELSSSIFKKIYFGPGYDFTYFSISVLARFGATQELQSGFKPGDQVTSSINTVPTLSKNKLDLGVTISFPLDLMIGWLGRSLGI
jgi:hypothetical protein